MLWRATSRPAFPEWLERESRPSDLDRTEGRYPNPIKRPPQREPHTPNQPPHPNRRPNRHGRRAPPALSGSVCAAAAVFKVPRSRGEPWFLHSPMAPRSPWWAVLLLPVLLAVAAAAVPPPEACLVPTAAESILGPSDTCSLLDRRLGDTVGVIEGDEATLARAVNLLHMNKDDYIAVLFYASWCPFSQECKPNFETLAYLFPTIRHFAFEESAIRPSIISRYGIHGFPTLFLLNSTMRVRYHGPRAVKPLAAFYSDVSGINASVKSTIGEGMVHLDEFEPKKDIEQENCPFWWARSPENILQQDTYLALATSFVILRLLYLLFPKIGSFAKRVWRHTIFAYLMGVHEYFFTYLEQARQKFNRLYPSKGANLQEGARNATAWASKSFVSIGEPSTIGRTNSTNELR